MTNVTSLFRRPSWAFLKRFNVRHVDRNRWGSVNRMKEKARAALGPTMRRYDVSIKQWETRLGSLAIDYDLKCFRPLRTTREEDWSDWLAWLLKTSTTGVLAEVLFGLHIGRGAAALKLPEEKREDPTEDQSRRVDIVLKWKKTKLAVDVEVKVEDRQIDKTYETARKIADKYKQYSWQHFILLSDDLAPAWSDHESNRANKDFIHRILWRDVVRGLRYALWQKKESLMWRVWALTFCRAIEEKLLGLTKPPSGSDISKLQMALSWLEILNSTGEKNYE